MFNLLYCFDSNYNTQSFVSIYSILENIDKKLNIFIIHKEESGNKFIPNKITQHKNLNQITVNQFKKNENKFFNLDNVHVSEATYYRLFLNEYIDKNIDNIIYIDGDVICIKNITEKFSEIEKALNESKFVISAMSEYTSINEETPEVLGLELKNNRYFNAGVMFIDLKKWKEKNISEELINILFALKEKINFWDQDVMNKFFDGDYLELNSGLNTKITNNEILTIETEEKILNKTLDVYLVHYAGKFKPWQVMGSVYKGAHYFQNNYKVLYEKNTFIQFTKRSNAIKQFASLSFISRFWKLKKRLRHFTSIVVEILFKKNIRA